MRLLIVEDDPDGREMLAELFRMHAWEVTAVPSTEAAMAELRAGGFEVVISDENLEGRSGSCMLREASAQGLLCDVGALMYTAEPGKLEVPDGVRVLRKPMGIAKLLDAAKQVGDSRTTPVPGSGPRKRNHVELVLYVTDSPSSRRALENMKHVLDATRPPHVKLVVHELATESPDDGAAEDRAAFSPVLVKRSGGTAERLVHDLESTHSLARLIEEIEAQVPASSQPSLRAAKVSSSGGDAPPSGRMG